MKEYTELLNRLSGLADEMGDFFNRLKALEIKVLEHMPPKEDGLAEVPEEVQGFPEAVRAEEKAPEGAVETIKTLGDCLQAVIDDERRK